MIGPAPFATRAHARSTVAAVAQGEVTPLPSSLREVLQALIEARIAVDRIDDVTNAVAWQLC